MATRLRIMVLGLAALGLVPAFAPVAMAQDAVPTFTLNKDAFNAARTVELSTAYREKLFADYSSLWGGIYRGGLVDADELAFLQSQIDGVPKVFLKGAATADWSPQDFYFNGNWSQVGGGGFDAPQLMMRARVAGWIAERTPVAQLIGKWPELTVSAAFFEELKSAEPAALFPRQSPYAVNLKSRMSRAGMDATEQGRIADALYSGPDVMLVRSAAGGEPVAFANVWARFGLLELAKMLPDGDLAPLWTDAPADFVKLVAPANKSPSDFIRVADFIARQLAPLAAESKPANAWQPMRTYMVAVRAAIRQLPEAERPAARQLLHDSLKKVGETMTPPMSATIYEFALRE